MGLGKIATYVNECYRTFQEEVAGALDGKDYLLVEPGTADNTVKLNTTAGNEVGVVFEKLQPVPEQIDVNIRLLGGDGTVKVVQSGAIAYGAKVICDPANPTKVKQLPAAAGTYRVLGRKVSEGGGAAGDVIELCDRLETVIIAA
jgi:hypothetical protein